MPVLDTPRLTLRPFQADNLDRLAELFANPDFMRFEIGYRLDPEYWNCGLMTEAARAVREHAFRTLNLSRVISLIHPDNVPSRRVAEKNGLVLEKQITFRSFPTNLFSLSRDRWLTPSGA